MQQDTCIDGADSENKKKQESKHPPQNQQTDIGRTSNSSKFVGAQATSSAADPAVGRSVSHSNPKKSSTRNEVGFFFSTAQYINYMFLLNTKSNSVEVETSWDQCRVREIQVSPPKASLCLTVFRCRLLACN